MNDSIKYEGIVTILNCGKKYMIHNTPTKNFFKFLCRAICGRYNPNTVPSFINIFREGNSILKDKILIRNKTYESIDNEYANLHFIINSDNYLDTKVPTQGDILTLLDVNGTELARIILPEIIDISENSNLIITWRISFNAN